MNEISSAYRNSRRNTSILCGIGIAWAAAQFEISKASLGLIDGVTLEGATLPIVLSFLCLYSLSRCTIEYMMQAEKIRRWSLAKIDYCITVYLVRITLLVLSASMISRSGETVFYVIIWTTGLVIASYVIFVPLINFFTLLSKTIKSRSENVHSSKLYKSPLRSFALYIIIIAIIVCVSYFTRIDLYGYIATYTSRIGVLPFIFLSSINVAVICSFFFDNKFLCMVFAYIDPMIIRRHLDDNGAEVVEYEPNPDHPNYQEIVREVVARKETNQFLNNVISKVNTKKQELS